MYELMEEFKKSFVREIFKGVEENQAAAFDITKFSLKDLELFDGYPFGSRRETFRWPTVEDLQILNLKNPLKLTSIKTT